MNPTELAIARAIYGELEDANYTADGAFAQAAAEDALQRVAGAVADVLAEATTSATFNRAAFVAVCETGEEPQANRPEGQKGRE